MNRHLLRLEFHKNLSKKHFSLFGLMLILIVVLFALVNTSNNSISTNKIIEYESDLNANLGALNKIPILKQTEKIRGIVSNQISIRKEQIIAINDGDWRTDLSLQNDYDVLNIEGMKNGNIQGGITIDGFERMIDHNNEFLKRDIKPFPANIGNTGFSFLYTVLDYFYGLLGILFFSLFFGGVLASEIEKKTIYLLFVQPISKFKILASKYIYSIFVSLFIIGIVILFTFILASVFTKTGSYNYPILVDLKDSYYYSNMLTIILKATGLFVLLTLFSISLIFFFSVLLKNSLLALSITMILFITSSTIFSKVIIIQPIIQYIPFSYIDVFDILTGNSFNYNYSTGIFTLILSIVLLNFATCFVFNKKEILS